MEGLIKNAILTAIDEWSGVLNKDDMNKYLDRHESTFVTFGLFLRGTRVHTLDVDECTLKSHYTYEGMNGIICMNLEILRMKIKK
jgi:hypothetical protein